MPLPARVVRRQGCRGKPKTMFFRATIFHKSSWTRFMKWVLISVKILSCQDVVDNPEFLTIFQCEITRSRKKSVKKLLTQNIFMVRALQRTFGHGVLYRDREYYVCNCIHYRIAQTEPVRTKEFSLHTVWKTGRIELNYCYVTPYLSYPPGRSPRRKALFPSGSPVCDGVCSLGLRLLSLHATLL